MSVQKKRGGIRRKDLEDARMKDNAQVSRLKQGDTIRLQNFWVIPWDSENPLSGLSQLSSASDSSIYTLDDMSLPSANYN